MKKFNLGDFVVTNLNTILVISNEFINDEYSTLLEYHFGDDYISFIGELFSKHQFKRYATIEEIDHIYELLKREKITLNIKKKEVTNDLKLGEVYIFWNNNDYVVSILDEIDEISNCNKYRTISGDWYLKISEFKSKAQFKKLFDIKKTDYYTIGKNYNEVVYLPNICDCRTHIGQILVEKADNEIKRLFDQGSGKYVKTFAKQYVFVNNGGKVDHIINMDENHTWIIKKTNKKISVNLDTLKNAQIY